MSYANFVGDTPEGESTRINQLITQKISRASVFQDIEIEGDLAIQGLTGGLKGSTYVETARLDSLTQPVADLSGSSMVMNGDLITQGHNVVMDSLEVGFATDRAVDTYTGDDNVLQVYAEDTSGENSVKAIRGDLLVSGGNGSASSQGVRSQLTLSGADVLEGYGGFTYARQDDGSRVRDNLIGHLGFAQVLETDASESPAQWIAGSQSIVGGNDSGGDLSGADIVCGSLAHVLYDTALNGCGHGFVASRNGSGAGSTAGSAFKVVNGSTIIPDWEYGLDMYNATAQPPSVADIRGSSASCIHFGSGVPAFATEPGSIFIRRDGGSSSAVLYVNHSGGAGDWSALT